MLREPKVGGPMPRTPDAERAILAALGDSGFEVNPLTVDIQGFRNYLRRARYDRYPHYYGGGRGPNFTEKALEHYVAATLLNLGPQDIYVDVACSDSPAAFIYRELFGCAVFRQDLAFAPGMHGEVLGGSAANMPVPDGFSTAMGLHCSFEHFEGDSDSQFIREANRVLRPGGRLCILPLYLYEHYAILTNPMYAREVAFESGATLYGDWRWPERHGRHYDAGHLATRVRDYLDGMRLNVFCVTNARDAYPSSYLRFAALIVKP